MAEIFVNGDAASGGDGSQAAPFTTLQEAFAVAKPFDVFRVAAALHPYDSPDDAPIRCTLPIDIDCDPGAQISAEFFFSGGPRVEFRNAHFINKPGRPPEQVDLPWPQRAQIMASPAALWLTDCTADGTQATKPLVMAYCSATLFIRARSRSCNIDYRGSQQMIAAGWYGSYISLRGQNGNILYCYGDKSPILSIEGSHGYLTDTDVCGVGNGTGVSILRGASCVFSSTGKNGTADRGRIRNVNTGIAASRKSYGHVEADFGFPSVTTQIANGTGASVVKL